VEEERSSLSAVTLSLLCPTEGFPLTRHNVFGDYTQEFDDVFRRRTCPAESDGLRRAA
jgi:1-hydroxycarotenoid 3,4-desaturase